MSTAQWIKKLGLCDYQVVENVSDKFSRLEKITVTETDRRSRCDSKDRAIQSVAWVVHYPHNYRQDCRVAANCRYCFYTQAKNQVFRPAGATRCTDSGQTLQDRRAPGSALLCKILPQSVQRGGNAAPKYQEFPLFGKESPRRGDSLDRFR